MAAAVKDGHEIVDAACSPDRIVVRCCSVTARAARDSRRALRALAKANPRAEIVPAGCIEGRARESGGGERGAGFDPPTARAHIDVQDGCSGRCAYCIVPSFRGSPRSVPWSAIEKEARSFIAAGCPEIVVSGCNLALYRDPESGIGLAGLLSRLACMESPGHRVRLGSLEPGMCDGEVLSAFAAHPNICRHLHVSLQSASAAVLAAMRRRYTPEAVAETVALARRIAPGLALGADLIAGFPGETENDFLETLSFVKDEGFVHLHVFPYSERPGTEAAAMPGAVPPGVRKARAAILQQAGDAVKKSFAEGFAGGIVEVAVERGASPGMPARGVVSEYLECEVEGPLPRRALARSLVHSVSGALLRARPV